MKRMLSISLIGICFVCTAVAMAAPNAEAAQLASGASSAAQKAHPFLMTLAHVVFILVLVTFGATLLKTLTSPRNPRR